MGAMIDVFGDPFGLHIGLIAMFYASACVTLVIGVVYAFTAARNPDIDVEFDERHSAEGNERSRRRPARVPADAATRQDDSSEPVAVPLPQMGRSA